MHKCNHARFREITQGAYMSKKNNVEQETDVFEESNEVAEDDLEEVSDDTAQDYLEKIDELRKELDHVQKSEGEAKDKMIRACAEMENVKRRAERDVTSAHKFALEKFAKDLLPVLDSMEQASEVGGDSAEVGSMRQGVEMTLKMFLDVAAKYNLKQINPVGEPFNPEEHEAISMQPNPDMDPNMVMAVFQKGYLLNDRVIRPARVVVTN